jgi:hypothetical protein
MASRIGEDGEVAIGAAVIGQVISLGIVEVDLGSVVLVVPFDHGRKLIVDVDAC